MAVMAVCEGKESSSIFVATVLKDTSNVRISTMEETAQGARPHGRHGTLLARCDIGGSCFELPPVDWWIRWLPDSPPGSLDPADLPSLASSPALCAGLDVDEEVKVALCIDPGQHNRMSKRRSTQMQNQRCMLT